MLKIQSNDKTYTVEPNAHNPSEGKVNDQEYSLDVVRQDSNRFNVRYGDGSYEVEIHEFNKTDKTAVINVNGISHTLSMQDDIDILLDKMGLSDALVQKVGEVKAPMPGLVLDIRVSIGDEIEEGDPLLVLEAMKMENVLKSPTAGKIKGISVEKGQAVEKNQILISFE
ncbi:biotin/lipoyl-containing protein [Phaeocystidibacter luteus]|uniref:Acetyl-CoA carboxylase biotin carboxyl carrier protein subunit n=1 Tax=Phaeocystidibacter luteus TaxID=911197 RepID=A0A6N6RFY5_9FLAO|nr:acetyl-CoA carboxylase biotin carboxyl carrier protein subunit [Phaeocystidibacter luteus]KAB2810081.1 acetyl-CoA carboxylase biotin carboxyl carrier protein subunit [Phaeocystidibacter luteus]